jgi:hypothetical protein
MAGEKESNALRRLRCMVSEIRNITSVMAAGKQCMLTLGIADVKIEHLYQDQNSIL